MRIIDYRILALLTLGGLVYGMAAYADPAKLQSIQIELKSKATIQGSRVYLSDVAKCSGNDQICKESSGIDISASPAAGRTMTLAKNSITEILSKEWPNTSIEVVGAEFIRVDATSLDGNMDDISAKLQRSIDVKLGSMTNQIRVHVSKLQALGIMTIRPTQSILTFPDVDFLAAQDLDWISKNLVHGRTMQVQFMNPNDSEDRSILNVHAYFDVYRHLPTLKSSLRSGQLIESQNIEWAWVQLKHGTQNFVLNESELLGHRTRQATGAKEAILSLNLELPPAVIRNQSVTMIVRNDDLEIATRATTVEQGAIGQTVEVINLATKKRMRAKVIDNTTVEAVMY